MVYFFAFLLGFSIMFSGGAAHAMESIRTAKTAMKKPKKAPKKIIDATPIKAASDTHTDAVIPGCYPNQNLITEVGAIRNKKGFNLFGLIPVDGNRISALKFGEYVKSNISVGEVRDIESRRIDSNNLITNKPLQDYANAILDCLKKVSGVSNVPGSVYIALTNDYFAQSSADGNIFISPAWFTSDKNNEAIIAMLLAHELAHVLLHHHDVTMAVRIKKQIQYYWTAGATMRNQLEERKQKEELTKQQYENLNKMQLLIEGSEQILLPTWQRKQELEADLLAVDLFYLAGYKNRKAPSIFLQSLKASEEKAAQTRAQELAAIDQQNSILISQGKFGDVLQLGISDTLKSIKVALAEKHPEHTVREKNIIDYNKAVWPIIKINRESELADTPPIAATANAPIQPTQLNPTAVATPISTVVLPAKRPDEDTLMRLKKHKDVAILKDELELFSTGYGNLKQQNFNEAQIAFERLIQGGLLSNHAHVIFSYYLSKKHLRQADAHETLKSSFSALDQAWKPYAEYARVTHNRHHKDKTSALLNAAHEKFKHSPALLPKLIALYGEFAMPEEANKLLNKCTSENEAVDYRDACQKAKNIKPNPTHLLVFESNVEL